MKTEKEFKQYRRKSTSEMRPYNPKEKWNYKISVSAEDLKNGSPKEGDMIARNPKNYEDQWLVAKKYFDDNLEENTPAEKECYEKEFTIWLTRDQIKFYPANDKEDYYAVCNSDYEEVEWYTLNEVYDYWKLNVKEVKEVKDIIADVDLKQIDQASDEYYNRPKLFERKK